MKQRGVELYPPPCRSRDHRDSQPWGTPIQVCASEPSRACDERSPGDAIQRASSQRQAAAGELEPPGQTLEPQRGVPHLGARSDRENVSWKLLPVVSAGRDGGFSGWDGADGGRRDQSDDEEWAAAMSSGTGGAGIHAGGGAGLGEGAPPEDGRGRDGPGGGREGRAMEDGTSGVLEEGSLDAASLIALLLRADSPHPEEGSGRARGWAGRGLGSERGTPPSPLCTLPPPQSGNSSVPSEGGAGNYGGGGHGSRDAGGGAAGGEAQQEAGNSGLEQLVEAGAGGLVGGRRGGGDGEEEDEAGEEGGVYVSGQRELGEEEEEEAGVEEFGSGRMALSTYPR